jgi:hypothetical protein
MKDLLSEVVVQVKLPKFLQLLRLALMPVTALLLLMALFGVPGCFLAACAAGAGIFFLTRKQATEYEYIHFNSDLDIDRVTFGSNRKHLMTVKLDQVELLASVDAPEVDRYGTWETKDFSSGEEGYNTYFMICRVGGKKMKLKLDLEPKIMETLSVRLRGKIL